MQVSKINFKETFRAVGKNLQETGETALKWCGKQNERFDTFVKSKDYDPKMVKQIGLGAALTVISVSLAVASAKSIINRIKDVSEEK